MEREIRFRVWDGDKMHYVAGPRFNDSGYSVGFLIDTDPTDYYSRKWEWMQYTGLKDKNGVEIYEGDLVIGVGRSKPDAIIFASGCFLLENAFMGGEATYWPPEIEVIGNIYEKKPVAAGAAPT